MEINSPYSHELDYARSNVIKRQHIKAYRCMLITHVCNISDRIASYVIPYRARQAKIALLMTLVIAINAFIRFSLTSYPYSVAPAAAVN